MGLTIPNLINLWGIIVSGLFALCSFGLAIVIFIYAKRKDKVKGPRLSIFDYQIEKIKSETSRSALIEVDNKLPKPKWVVIIPYMVLNIGDTSSYFVYNASLTLDVKGEDNKLLKVNSITPVSEVFEPNEWKTQFGYAFSFEFDDIKTAHQWKEATIEITGHYYDHKSNRKNIEIDPQTITNKFHPQKLSKEVQDEID